MIHVGFISTLGRLRSVDPTQVAALAASIAEVGLLNPITVYRREIIRNGQPAEGFGLVAGAHRLEACKSLGWQEVPAVIVDLDENDRTIAECDENLCATKLTPTEAAMFTAERKRAYEAKHPETAHGKASPGKDDNLSSFAADTAAKTGVDARTVQRNAERGAKVTTAAMAMVKGTGLDTGAYLDKLKKVAPADQPAKVKADLAALRDKAPKPPRVAPVPKDDADVFEAQLAALMSAWNRASREARDEFLSRIDRPVFDAGDAA